MSTLLEQQRHFAEYIISGGEPVPGALLLKQSSSNQFKDDQRLQVYRNNFLIGMREALSNVYPVINKLVGEEFFQHVAREYIQCYPSHTGNLHDYGDSFATFLESVPGLEALPYLPDVARLEWAYHAVFHAKEGEVLNLQTLAALDEKQLSELVFQVSPSCVLLKSRFPILRIWQLNQSDQNATEESLPISLDDGGEQCVVLRHGLDINFLAVSAGIFALIESLSQNTVFEQACGDALAAEAECDIAAALQFLVEQKIVCGFSLASATFPD